MSASTIASNVSVSDSWSPKPDQRALSLQGEIRNALEYMGPKYTALLQMGVEDGNQMHARPPPSTEMIRQGLVRSLFGQR